MEELGVCKCSQGNRDAEFGEVYRPSADHGSRLGGVAVNIIGV